LARAVTQLFSATHDELMDQDGPYAKPLEVQAAAYR
jgi:hypothetical protein